MQKFIHDDFELDLSSYQINRIEENTWFSDTFFTKYTFPFEIKLTDEISTAFGAIKDFNVESPRTFYKGYLFIDGTHHEAELEILETLDHIASVEISYGFEELPNFDKKLSELPLEKNDLPESLFDHAEAIIDKTYPAVNYNFVQVHTDSFDPEEDRWLGFERIVNNYKNGAFLVNEFDVNDNLTYNRNIMIPMPYLLHVLKAGFQDAGFNLKGDILTDPDILKMLFYKETEEYVNARIEGEEIVYQTDEYLEQYRERYSFGFLSLGSITTTLGRYGFDYTFPKVGRYKVAGNIYLRRENSEAEAKVLFKGNQVWRRYEGLLRSGFSSVIRTVDIIVDVENINDVLRIESNQISYGMVNDVVENQQPLVDLTITPLAIYENGSLIPPIITTQKLDLTKCVPDVTFGDLVKCIKNWKNMDISLDGKDIYMNSIEPQLSVTDCIDLSNFNQKTPRRRFSQGDSFLLKFADVDDENLQLQSVYVDIDGVQTDGFSTNEKTNEIVISAIPLPNVFRNDVTTALAVDDGKSKMCFVLYEGQPAQLNVAEDNIAIQMPEIYAAHWSKWLDFRLRSQGFVTRFRAHQLLAREITGKSHVFMYNNYHLIRVLNKTNVPGRPFFEVELEMESLK